MRGRNAERSGGPKSIVSALALLWVLGYCDSKVSGLIVSATSAPHLQLITASGIVGDNN